MFFFSLDLQRWIIVALSFSKHIRLNTKLICHLTAPMRADVHMAMCLNGFISNAVDLVLNFNCAVLFSQRHKQKRCD